MINRESLRAWGLKHNMLIQDPGVFQGLDAKKKAFGVAYCPCVPAYMHSEETICPCKNWRENNKSLKECHCGLFKKEE